MRAFFINKMYFLLPDLYLLYFHQNVHFFLMSFFILIYIYSFFKSTKYFFLFLPFLILTPFYLYYISIYKTAINEQILSIVLETNFDETVQFLGTKVSHYIIIFFIWCFFSITWVVKHYKKPKVWSHWSRYVVLILGTTYFISGYFINEKISDEIEQVIGQNNFLVEEENQFFSDLKQTYPLGLIINGWYTFKEQKKINQAFDKNNNFKFNAIQLKKTDTKEVYVLVLGETSRRENWQLNGYHHLTNPLLSQQKNLINFTNFISVSNVTRESIPMMLTRKLDKQVNKYAFNERSVITAFKEAGFKTYWISTQQKFGAFDTSTSVYAKEADEIYFLNKTGYQNAGVYDDILIQALEKIVQQAPQKQFIVIHTLGSHYNYQHRYPGAFSKFRPALDSLKSYSLQDRQFKREIINSYDNSILFTDYVLDQFIHTLEKQESAISLLMYSSDHGEDIFDEGCHKSGHGLETARNFEIASFIWYSNNFKNKFNEKVIKLKNNQHRKMNQTAIFPTLIDAANISIPNETLDRSILTSFEEYPRLVMGGVDYDQANFIGECKEIK